MSIQLIIKAIETGMYCDGYSDAEIAEKSDWIYHRALMISEGK